MNRGRHRAPNRLIRLAAALAAALLVASLVLRDAGTALVVTAPVEEPDAIVSLASHEWERLPTTARLAARHPSSLILLTMPRDVTRFNCHDCAGRAKWLMKAGVRPDRILVLPEQVSNTYDEALSTLAYARLTSIGTVLVVTSPYHTRRAFAIFRHIFKPTGVRIGIHPAGAPSPADPERWWRHAYDRAYVSYEWAATLYYAARHGFATEWLAAASKTLAKDLL